LSHETGQVQFVSSNLWEIIAQNSPPPDELTLDFATATNPASLVGFTDGVISGGGVPPFYNNLSGSITPVPEPSSLVQLAGGLGWLVFGVARRFGNKSAVDREQSYFLKRPDFATLFRSQPNPRTLCLRPNMIHVF
jgi:hypothetical protein